MDPTMIVGIAAFVVVGFLLFLTLSAGAVVAAVAIRRRNGVPRMPRVERRALETALVDHELELAKERAGRKVVAAVGYEIDE